ncbi:MAG TPA: DUF63 family protein [Methanothrix sp.]|nr:DUF63 family protein [Methanothrix sp.]HOK58349.1 DUF63 family protein [Methanothrix sp.]HOL43914.1 DUF63 family protein [Methanothrix sp.]HPO88448.1 DUF63 family protein [Methanothrix sp.]
MNSLSEQIVSFVQRYYVEPVINDSGYNPVNTVTWAILLGFFIVLIHRAFRRYGIGFSRRFILATAPYIIAGSSLRVIEDAELVDPPVSYLLITPLIYLLVASVTLIALFISRRLTGGYRLYSAIGISWSILNLLLLIREGVQHPWVPLAVIALGSSITGCVLLLSRHLPHRFSIPKNGCAISVILSHMLDASSTYIGIDWLGYEEKHVVPTLLIHLVGSAAVMYPVKLIVLLPLLAILDESLRDDRDMLGILMLTLLVLGLAPATRNTLRMTLGI